MALTMTISFYNIFPHNLYLHKFAHRHIQRYNLMKELIQKTTIITTHIIGIQKTRRFGILTVL
jgi:hypothetical protein